MKLNRIRFVSVFLIFGLQSYASDLSPTPVVLVHGASISARGWQWVESDLSKMGIPAVAPELYDSNERVDLAAVSTRLCEQLKGLHKPVVLVGHSQGGAIITEAAAQCADRVQALIYVAAVLPQPGEGVFDDLSQGDNDNFAECGTLNSQTNSYDLLGLVPCRKVFFGDGPISLAGDYYAAMRSEPAGIGNSKAAYAASAIQKIPKFYIETQKDLILSPDTQKRIIAKNNFLRILSIDSSHTPFFWRHAELSALLASLLTETTLNPRRPSRDFAATTDSQCSSQCDRGDLIILKTLCFGREGNVCRCVQTGTLVGAYECRFSRPIP